MKKIFKIILLIYALIGFYILLFVEANIVYRPFLLPSKEHFLGTNSYGLDIFNIMFASILYLFVMCIFGIFSFTLGLIIGCTQGYLKGKYDFLLQRIYEIIISIPYFYIVILFSGYFELNIFNLGFILMLFNWTFLIPLIRLQTFKVSKYSFINSMENLGYSKSRIIFFHILPNVYNNVKQLLPFILILFMSSLTALDFLGLSSTVNMSVGGLIAEGINYLDFPIILVSASSFLSLIFISLLMVFDVNKYYEGN
jgi:microcin C transport system permease protein